MCTRVCVCAHVQSCVRACVRARISMQNMVRSDAPGVIVRVLNYMVEDDDDDDDDRWGQKRCASAVCPALRMCMCVCAYLRQRACVIACVCLCVCA